MKMLRHNLWLDKDHIDHMILTRQDPFVYAPVIGLQRGAGKPCLFSECWDLRDQSGPARTLLSVVHSHIFGFILVQIL